jgi:hypothetical protein
MDQQYLDGQRLLHLTYRTNPNKRGPPRLLMVFDRQGSVLHSNHLMEKRPYRSTGCQKNEV